MIAERNRNALDAFKLFIGLYSAIVGGAIWLSTQVAEPKPRYAWLADVVVLLVTFVASILVFEAKRGWLGYRKRQSELAGKDEVGRDRIKYPTLWPTALTEGAMVAGMLGACAVFVSFNPLYPN